MLPNLQAAAKTVSMMEVPSSLPKNLPHNTSHLSNALCRSKTRICTQEDTCRNHHSSSNKLSPTKIMSPSNKEAADTRCHLKPVSLNTHIKHNTESDPSTRRRVNTVF